MDETSHHTIWTSTRPLPTPSELKTKFPATKAQHQFQKRSREQIGRILDGVCPRFLVIVGPCSVHDTTAALEYATKLKILSEKVSDTLLLVMRVYFEKPRTSLGWRGMLYDPTLDGQNDIEQGIYLTRNLLTEINSLELPTATEFLSATTPQYFGDLISWACIGARTVTSQPHRQLASGLPMPVGLKNDTEGNIDLAVNAIITAREPHSFIGIDHSGKSCVVETVGNPHAHLVLRGGRTGSNYHPESVDYATEALTKATVPPRLLIDCAHDNCGKIHTNQVTTFRNVIDQVSGHMANNEKKISGALLESHLYSGKQQLIHPIDQLDYAVSLTDPCIDWETTEELMTWAHERLLQVKSKYHLISAT